MRIHALYTPYPHLFNSLFQHTLTTKYHSLIHLSFSDINEEKAYHGQAKLRRQIIMPQYDRGSASISSLTPNDFVPVLCAKTKKPSIKASKGRMAESNTDDGMLPPQSAPPVPVAVPVSVPVPISDLGPLPHQINVPAPIILQVPVLQVPIPPGRLPPLPPLAPQHLPIPVPIPPTTSFHDGGMHMSDSGSELDPDEEEERALEILGGGVVLRAGENENNNPPSFQQQQYPQPQQQQQQQQQQQPPQQQKGKRKAVSKPPSKATREKRPKSSETADT